MGGTLDNLIYTVNALKTDWLGHLRTTPPLITSFWLADSARMVVQLERYKLGRVGLTGTEGLKSKQIHLTPWAWLAHALMQTIDVALTINLLCFST